MPEKSIIGGDSFKDHRGCVRFFNCFNMQEIVRFYEITASHTEFIRGWQAHQMERKWFYCLQGSFIINLIKIDTFNEPSDHLKSLKYILKDSILEILHVPKGHATAIKAITEGARLQVFSNFSLEESEKDDYRFPLEKWSADWKTT